MGKLGGGEENGEEAEIKSFVFRAGLCSAAQKESHFVHLMYTSTKCFK